MKVLKTISIVAAAMVASFAFNSYAADDGGLPKSTPDTSNPKTRAEVKEDRAKAAKKGELNQNSHANPVGDKTVQGTKKTRAEVKSETAVAKKEDGGTLKSPKN